MIEIRVKMTPHLGCALFRLVEQDLRHPLDGDGEGYHGVVRHKTSPGVHGAGEGGGPALGPRLPGVDVTV